MKEVCKLKLSWYLGIAHAQILHNIFRVGAAYARRCRSPELCRLRARSRQDKVK